jgi:hypothetical protein
VPSFPIDVILVEDQVADLDRVILTTPHREFIFGYGSVRKWCDQNGLMSQPVAETDNEYTIPFHSLSDWALFFGKFCSSGGGGDQLTDLAEHLREAERCQMSVSYAKHETGRMLRALDPFDSDDRKRRDRIVKQVEDLELAVTEFVQALSRQVEERIARKV